MPTDQHLIDSGSELGRRYVTDFNRVEAFYASDYRRPEHLAEQASRLLNRTWRTRYDRDTTADLLAAYADAHNAPAPVRNNIDRLRDKQAVCILTGQQAGLGGGPLLVLYKALTAIKLADEVERASGQPCVPIFWNASDDSDIEEVNRIRSVGADGKLRKFRFDISAGRRHVRDIALPGADDASWAEAAAALGDGPFAGEARALLATGAGLDFGAAFTRLLHELLGERGLIVIEPRALVDHPAFKRLHVLEVDKREERRQALQRVADRLESLGMPAGVPLTNHLNLFKTVKGERRHVTTEGRRLIVEGEGDYSKTALIADIRANPGLYTPNVLLRPLVQNAIFPTVAYVGGPAEIAYHGLLKGLHRSSQVFMPALFPRLSMTLVDGADARGFDQAVKFRQRLKWRQREAAIVAEEAQAGVRRAFTDLRANLQGLAKPLEAEVQKFEQRTARAVGDVMTRVKYDPIHVVEGGEDIAPLLNRYFPEDRPQERAITLLAAWARYGPGLLAAADGVPDPFNFHHHIAVM